MARILFLVFLVLAFPLKALAAEAPSGQIPIGAGQVLRGRFVQESAVKGFDGPLQSTGHFVAVPARGLIWSIEKPFPTATIVTPKEAVQDLGGITIKLPVKNLRHLYEMVGAALAGDWSGLETDYVITSSGKAGRWRMLLTPRRKGKSALPYASIAVSGGRFVENIAMMKTDGSADTLSFTDETLSPAPPGAAESAAFAKASQ